MHPSIVAFADGEVGLDCVSWLASRYKNDIAMLFTTEQNQIFETATANGLNTQVFENEKSCIEKIDNYQNDIDLGLLLWWPKLISPLLIEKTKHGFINTHPSLLPHNRGRHYNFWCIVEQCPFGVSLHLVEEGIDCGSVVAQSHIDYSWEDTGETLYRKALNEMKALFKNTYPSLRSLSFNATPQDLSTGSIHYASELKQASTIDLDETKTARQLLNLLRARTFRGHPACTFKDGEVEYEARIQITKKQ